MSCIIGGVYCDCWILEICDKIPEVYTEGTESVSSDLRVE